MKQGTMVDHRGNTASCDPRVARSRAAVLAAAAELLVEEGFRGVSIEAVAARAGVAKTTIYRHWPTRADLLVAAFRGMGCMAPYPGCGAVREDLIAMVGALAHELRTAPWARVLPSLAAEAAREPGLAELYREFMDDTQAPLRRIVDDAVDRGELPGDVDRSLLIAMIGGPVFFRAFVSLEPLDDPSLPERIVDAALEGLRRATVRR